MYAVFQSGGKQYRVSEGQVVRLEKIDHLIGEIVSFTTVLMIVNNDRINVGSPLVKGGVITAEIMTHGRGDKINIIKFRARKHYRKHQGHRQYFTDLKIISIMFTEEGSHLLNGT
ncbi:50S ribosomal protein L21 [Candidatus Erwinia haradaeae]|uniref:Large ribosomal subunit protein bL21 n=1 Tax=Candidatus Erwinia haradaeae TaxID=1922217 RepID=A0A451DCA2_9GAMM|nr:50S ribosomal protein L21 [Candidatus Erwinia haradaeae]VFP84056.1 50S ribosomal protein L21 [Candidatus Erwinia haradaeae]